MGFRGSGFGPRFLKVVFLLKVVFDEFFFDEIDHFHPIFDESVPDPGRRFPGSVWEEVSRR